MIHIPYYLGQFGLLLAALSSLGILQLVGESQTRPPAYYFIFVWLVGMACALTFSEPILYAATPRLSTIGYTLRLLFGLERAAVFWFYHSKKGEQLQIAVIRRVNRYVTLATVLVILSAGGYGIYSMIAELRQETQQVKKEVRAATKLTDAALVKELTIQNDSLRHEVTANRTLIASLTTQVSRQSNQITHMVGLITDLSELIADLKRSVRRVDANVERTRRTVPTPPKIEKKPPLPIQVDPKHIPKTTYNYVPD